MLPQHPENGLYSQKRPHSKTLSKWLPHVPQKEQVVNVLVSWPGLYKYTHGGPVPTEHATRKDGSVQWVQCRRWRPRSSTFKQVSNQRSGESKTHVSYVMVRISIPGFQRMWVWSRRPPGLNQVNLKLVGCLSFSGRQIIPAWLWRRKNIGKSKHGGLWHGEWASPEYGRHTSYGVTKNSDRCSGLPVKQLLRDDFLCLQCRKLKCMCAYEGRFTDRKTQKRLNYRQCWYNYQAGSCQKHRGEAHTGPERQIRPSAH